MQRFLEGGAETKMILQKQQNMLICIMVHLETEMNRVAIILSLSNMFIIVINTYLIYTLS